MNHITESLSLLWTFLLKRTKVTVLLAFFISIFGVISFIEIPRETTPQIDIPVGTITTVWPGASTKNIENLITNKLEQEIKQVENIEKYTSTSKSGLSVIVVNFEQGTDQDQNIQNLKDKVDTAKYSLPSAIPNDPIVQKLSFSDSPVVSFALSGDYAWSELKEFAERISDEVKNVTDVKDVSIVGAPEPEMHILLDPLLLEKQSLSIDTVLQSIRGSHRNAPLGVIDSNGESIEISVESEMKQAEEFAQIPLKTQDGAVLKLGDIATIRREYKTFSVETYFQVNADQSNPGILIDVIKSAKNGNVIKMVDLVEQKIETLKAENVIPKNLDITKTFDMAKEINDSMSVLIDSGLQTLLLIVVVLLFAVGWREALLAGVTIPLSMLVGIIALNSTGNTFNNVSLFALVIAVGLLVDTAIVIVEGMSEAINDKKMSPYDAAIETLQTFRWPLITGTLTTVFAFAPLAIFIDGVSGEFIKVIPITVTVVLLGALIISLFLLPNFGVSFFEAIPPVKHAEKQYLVKAKRWYKQKTAPILKSAKKSFLVIFLSFAALIASVSLVITGFVSVEVFPPGDVAYLNIDITYPTGTSISETRKIIPEVTKRLAPYFANNEDAKEKWIKNVVFTAGASQIKDGGKKPSDSENMLGTTVNFVSEEERNALSPEIAEVLQKAFEDFPSHIEVDFVQTTGGPPTGAPIEIRFTGDNLVEMEAHVETLKQKMSAINGLKQISDSRKDKTKQLTWKFDREKLNFFGLAPATVLESLRTAVNGVKVVSLTEGDQEIDVSLRIDWDETRAWKTPTSLDILNKIPLQARSGKMIALQDVATPNFTQELSQIDHREGQRVITVSAYLEKGLTAASVSSKIQAAINEINTLPGETIELGGDSEEGNKLMGQSAMAMVFALFLIFILLVIQFNSYSQPFIILSLIPLSLTGVFTGFAAIGQTLSFPSMIGIVSLAGIIVNDAIVLMDQINVNRKKGLSVADAAIAGAQQRFQPIFLTSVTTVVGMLPLSLSDPLWSGLGFAIVFGMLLSTILCLLLVPCLLVLDESVSKMVAKTTKSVWKKFKKR